MAVCQVPSVVSVKNMCFGSKDTSLCACMHFEMDMFVIKFAIDSSSIQGFHVNPKFPPNFMAK